MLEDPGRTDDRYAVCRDCLNLAVVPSDYDGLYRHQENHPGDVHADWLKRLVCLALDLFAKDDLEPWENPACAKTVRNGVDRTLSGGSLGVAVLATIGIGTGEHAPGEAAASRVASSRSLACS